MKLKKLLSNTLTEDEQSHVIQSFDVVGDICIIIVPEELAHREPLIGKTILDAHANIKVVAKRAGNYDGKHRTIPLEIIAGEDRKETMHREFGIVFKLNPEKVYFSVRSSTERKRIADKVGRNERVLVMFSGIAPYPLYIAKFSHADRIIGVELNPDAHIYAMENLSLNKIRGGIELYNGDAAEIVPTLDMTFDRVVMPLPKSGADYVPLALKYLKHGGYIHHYVMQNPDTLHHAIEHLADLCRRSARTLTHHESSVCGHTGPQTYRYCIDARID